MSNSRLALFFGGTDMTWEDMAISLQLGINNRHNLADKETKYLHYCFDGPASAISNQHKPVEHLVFDKDENEDFMRSSKRKVKNVAGYRFRWGFGKGTNHITTAAYELIKESILTRAVREIDLIGFSRGGSIALNVGAMSKWLARDLKGKLSQEEINTLSVNIFAIDPVAGKGRNKAATQYGKLSQFVKKCIVGLATNESLPGFHPRDSLTSTTRYKIQYDAATQFAVLPFPEDHAMCVQWMSNIIRNQIPADSELLIPCDEKRLINRRLGLEEVKWIDRVDNTRAYRLIHYVNNKSKYIRNCFSPDVKQNVEEFFRFLGSQRSHINIGHISLQNDADTEKKARFYEGKKIGGLHPKTKSTQQKFARKNCKKRYKKLGFHDRNCKVNLLEYTNVLFVNLLHEAEFKKAYPDLYRLFLHWDEKDLESALVEFQSIAEEKFSFTKMYVENALIEKIQLKPIEQFRSTNAKSLDELLSLMSRLDVADEKKEESKVEMASEHDMKLNDSVVRIEIKPDATEISDSKKEKSCMLSFLQFKFFTHIEPKQHDSSLKPTFVSDALVEIKKQSFL